MRSTVTSISQRTSERCITVKIFVEGDAFVQEIFDPHHMLEEMSEKKRNGAYTHIDEYTKSLLKKIRTS